MPRKISKLKLSATLPPVRILSHYFVARFLGLFSTILVGALILVATVELVLNLDDMASFGHETPSVFRYLWVRLASYYLSDLLPIASFLAAFVAFAWAGRSRLGRPQPGARRRRGRRHPAVAGDRAGPRHGPDPIVCHGHSP
jgi:NhaP-type Na+/H+ or K+/H+ antiporter